MLWRDLAGRLRGLAEWIDHYREPGHYVGGSHSPPDPIIDELDRTCQRVVEEWRFSVTDPPTDRGAPPRRTEEGG